MCIKFEGKLLKKGKYWSIYVPSLDIYTQGTSKKDALFMIKEAIELSVNEKGFEISIDPLPQNRFILRSKKIKNEKYLIALLLKNQRAKYGLSTQEVANRLGVSKHAYAQYEQARSIPSITKIEEFIYAMNDRAHVVLDIFDESMVA